MIKAQGLLWHCSQDVCWGHSNGKAWLGLEDLLPKWLTIILLTDCLSFSPYGPARRLLGYPTTWQFAFPRENGLKIQDGSCHIFYDLPAEVMPIISEMSYWLLLWTKCLCLSKLHMLKFWSQCDGIWRWDLWEVIRFSWNHEDGVLMIRLVLLWENEKTRTFSLWHVNIHQEVGNRQSRRRNSHQNSVSTLILDHSSLQNCEKINVCCLSYSVYAILL